MSFVSTWSSSRENPIDHMEWLRNLLMIDRGEDGASEISLFIDNLAAENAGEYHCLVEFTSGERQMTSAGFLTIHSKKSVQHADSRHACTRLHVHEH